MVFVRLAQVRYFSTSNQGQVSTYAPSLWPLCLILWRIAFAQDKAISLLKLCYFILKYSMENVSLTIFHSLASLEESAWYLP